jgi:uncharacterized protein YbbK (DUF523 family)
VSAAHRKVVVSACLLGARCRYDGRGQDHAGVREALQDAEVIAVCPEQLGGLDTPRPPSEFRDGTGDALLNKKARIVGRDDGVDRTDAFLQGAERALAAAEGATSAILKARSPSCGYQRTWREGQVVDGHGVFAALLNRAGLTIRTEEDFD